MEEVVAHFLHNEVVADFHCDGKAVEHFLHKRDVVTDFHSIREVGVVMLMADTLLLSCLDHDVNRGSHGGIPF